MNTNSDLSTYLAVVRHGDVPPVSFSFAMGLVLALSSSLALLVVADFKIAIVSSFWIFFGYVFGSLYMRRIWLKSFS